MRHFPKGQVSLFSQRAKRKPKTGRSCLISTSLCPSSFHLSRSYLSRRILASIIRTSKSREAQTQEIMLALSSTCCLRSANVFPSTLLWVANAVHRCAGVVRGKSFAELRHAESRCRDTRLGVHPPTVNRRNAESEIRELPSHPRRFHAFRRRSSTLTLKCKSTSRSQHRLFETVSRHCRT